MGRYEAREGQPGMQMFDQGVEDHCWFLFDTKTAEAVPGQGMLEHVARRRADEWSRLDALGHRTLTVTFVRTGEKHKQGCVYDVCVEGVRIGSLYRDYEPGWVAGRLCVGGSMPGYWAWYFEASPELAEAYKDEVETLWFLPSGHHWDKQQEAFTWFRQALDEPLNREQAAHDWWVRRVCCFLRFLEKALHNTNPEPGSDNK